MRRYLLDSGIAQEYAQRHNPVFDRAEARVGRGDKIGVCTPIYGELLGGIELSETRDRNMQRLALAMSRLILWPFDERATEEYGRLYALLQRIGRPMQAIDIQIVPTDQRISEIIPRPSAAAHLALEPLYEHSRELDRNTSSVKNP